MHASIRSGLVAGVAALAVAGTGVGSFRQAGVLICDVRFAGFHIKVEPTSGQIGAAAHALLTSYPRTQSHPGDTMSQPEDARLDCTSSPGTA